MIHFLWKNTVLQSISQAGHLLFPFSHISAFAEIQSHVLEKLHSVLTFLLDCNWGNLHCLLSTAATPTRLRCAYSSLLQLWQNTEDFQAAKKLVNKCNAEPTIQFAEFCQENWFTWCNQADIFESERLNFTWFSFQSHFSYLAWKFKELGIFQIFEF